MINTAGEIENVYSRTNPFRLWKGVLLRDGEVPVIPTEHGKLPRRFAMTPISRT
jgi:hypothetical protein